MKKTNVLFILLAFVFSCFVNLYAADINNGLNDKVVGNNPAVSGKVVDSHIRLIEFILGTRMTVAQKQIFFKAIENEVRNMDTDQLSGFLDSLDLTESLNQLSDQDAEPIRQLLEKDFNATISSLEGQNDLAAEQFKKVKANVSEKVISDKNIKLTRQSIEAFAEYLAFIADTKKPVWPSDLSINATLMRIKTNFNSYTEEEKSSLEDFQLTWYLIRAAWQMADPKTKAAWQKDFDKLGLKPGADVTSSNIKSALSSDVYADLLDFATRNGVEPVEWSPKTKALVW